MSWSQFDRWFALVATRDPVSRPLAVWVAGSRSVTAPGSASVNGWRCIGRSTPSGWSWRIGPRNSYVVIDELRVDAFGTYASIDWAATGMWAEDYWQDLCELSVAEPYALTHRQETLAFERVSDEHAEVVEAILRRLAAQWRDAYEYFCAEQAEQLVAWLHVARRRYERYTDTARALGSSAWMPIVALAEPARSAHDAPLAHAVFQAADRPGAHRGYLRRRCYELTGWQVAFSAGPE